MTSSAQTPRRCANPSCGKDIEHLNGLRKFCSRRCTVAVARTKTKLKPCAGVDHVFSVGDRVCRCGAFEVNDSCRGMTRRATEGA